MCLIAHCLVVAPSVAARRPPELHPSGRFRPGGTRRARIGLKRATTPELAPRRGRRPATVVGRRPARASPPSTLAPRRLARERCRWSPARRAAGRPRRRPSRASTAGRSPRTARTAAGPAGARRAAGRPLAGARGAAHAVAAGEEVLVAQQAVAGTRRNFRPGPDRHLGQPGGRRPRLAAVFHLAPGLPGCWETRRKRRAK